MKKNLYQLQQLRKKQNQKIQEELQPEKNLQNITKKREKQKRLAAKKKFQKKNKDEIPKENNQEGSFSLTQILSVVIIVVSLAGLYYKRKELMSFVKHEINDFQASPIREMNSERRERRVGQIKISEEDLERLREEKQKMEDSKLKPMD